MVIYNILTVVNKSLPSTHYHFLFHRSQLDIDIDRDRDLDKEQDMDEELDRDHDIDKDIE